jgi:hypothetical protein
MHLRRRCLIAGTTGGKSADAKSGAERQRHANTVVVFAVVSALFASVFLLGS